SRAAVKVAIQWLRLSKTRLEISMVRRTAGAYLARTAIVGLKGMDAGFFSKLRLTGNTANFTNFVPKQAVLMVQIPWQGYSSIRKTAVCTVPRALAAKVMRGRSLNCRAVLRRCSIHLMAARMRIRKPD